MCTALVKRFDSLHSVCMLQVSHNMHVKPRLSMCPDAVVCQWHVTYVWLDVQMQADLFAAVLRVCPVPLRLEVRHDSLCSRNIVTSCAGIVTITWRVWALPLMMMLLMTILLMMLPALCWTLLWAGKGIIASSFGNNADFSS
jgi:hypothetical protein